MNTELVHEDPVARIHPSGPRLDARAAKQLLLEASAALTRKRAVLLIDLSALRGIDSLGIAALVTIATRARGQTRVALCGASPTVEQLLYLTHLHDLFEIFPDVRTAVAVLMS